jgi:hypothetical protein
MLTGRMFDWEYGSRRRIAYRLTCTSRTGDQELLARHARDEGRLLSGALDARVLVLMPTPSSGPLDYRLEG